MVRHVRDVAKLDVEREVRTGIPEVILAEGKADEHLREIALAFAESKGRILVSRLAPERLALFDGLDLALQYHPEARLLVVSTHGAPPPPRTGGKVGILAAGTADIAVAEEARLVAEELGCEVLKHYDVGVAGLHRLFPALDALAEAGVDAIVTVAGREGALAPVVAGLVDVPVIGLPVSTGYGFGGGGQAALSTMLQSCAPLTVVNIDAGFVAGATAAQFANRVARARSAGAVQRAEAEAAARQDRTSSRSGREEAAADRTGGAPQRPPHG